jgi:membrane-associated phospholipid phosphatase
MNIWYAITVIGEPEFWVAFSLLLLGFYFLMRGLKIRMNVKMRRFLVYLVPSIFITILIVGGIKLVIQMPRPCIPCPAELCNPYCDQGYSFPSAHAAMLFTVFTSLIFAARKHRSQYLLAYAIPLAVAFSRIVLGVHTYLDIFVGAAIGVAVPVALWLLVDKKLLDLMVQPSYRFRLKPKKK